MNHFLFVDKKFKSFVLFTFLIFNEVKLLVSFFFFLSFEEGFTVSFQHKYILFVQEAKVFTFLSKKFFFFPKHIYFLFQKKVLPFRLKLFVVFA